MSSLNKKIIKKILIVALSLLSIVAVFLGTSSIDTVSAVPALCVTDACKKADAAYQNALNNAANTNASANALEREIAHLNSEIAVLEAGIKANEAVANDLKSRIAATEKKLTQQTEALADLMIDMHFNKPADAVKVLASSSSISDLVERQTRKETIETEIAAVAKEIKRLKLKLEEEKTQVDNLIKEQESQRAAIVSNRNRQDELMRKYRNDAAAFERDAEAARRIRDQEIETYRQQYINSLGGGTIVDPGLNTYPKASECPGLNWRYTGDEYSGIWGGLYCECTSYAGWKAHEYRNSITISGWGDAKNWGNVARRKGWTVLSYQEAKAAGRDVSHTIGYYTSGPWGHVVWIEKDYGNGTVAYSEYNGAVTANFTYNTGRAGNAWGFNYIFLP